MLSVILMAMSVQGDSVKWFQVYEEALSNAQKTGRAIVIDAGRAA